jgi:hypothetical protein
MLLKGGVKMNNNFLKDFKIAPIPDLGETTRRQIGELNKVNEDIWREQEKERIRKENYNQELLSTLKKIEQNTGDISHIISILQVNSGKQDEILSVMKEIFEIGKAKTAEEADSLYRNAMNKANQFNEDVSTATALLGYAKVVWIAAKEYLNNMS